VLASEMGDLVSKGLVNWGTASEGKTMMYPVGMPRLVCGLLEGLEVWSLRLLTKVRSSVYRSSPMNLKKTGNPTQLNQKGLDFQLQLHQFWNFPVASSRTQKKRENR
jgi:hypothetical protein